MRSVFIGMVLLAMSPWWVGQGLAEGAVDPIEECLECHGSHGTGSKRLIDRAEFQNSIHGDEVSCLECHPQAESEAHQKNTAVTPVMCLDCHDIQGVHGAGAGSKNDVRCYHCHGKHGILPRSDPASTLSRQNMARTCAVCHVEGVRPRAIGASLLSFRLKGHGKGDSAEHFSRERCLDCHQGKAAHMEEQPLTEAACFQCHQAKSGAYALIGSFHGLGYDSATLSGDIVYLSLLAVALVIFVWGWGRRVNFWLKGGPEPRWNRLGQRFAGLFRHVVGHRGLFRHASDSGRHYLLFLGILLPLAVILLVQVWFRLPGWWAALVSLVLDVVGAGLLVGVVLAAVRSFRCSQGEQGKRRASLVGLVLLGLIAASGFLVEGTRLAHTESAVWMSPVGSLASLIVPESGAGAHVLWRLHLLLVLTFLALTPFCRLRHIVAAPLNIFFLNLEPRGRLRPVDLQTGVDVHQDDSHSEIPWAYPDKARITWKTRLDFDACLACERCQDVCPANLADKPLSPMRVIGAMRTALISGDKVRLNEAVTDDEVWACTTCQACVEVCPVRIEHVDTIVGLRRSLVLNEGRLPDEAARLLRHLEVYGDPGGMDGAHRDAWARTMQRTASVSAQQPPDIHLWLGCHGYAHPRGREVATALVRLVERAGETVHILGNDELCCGDPARRIGGEDVFQSLALKNIERLKQIGARRIMVFCPHCFNTLANEYPDFGADFEVIQALSWLSDRIEAGELKMVRPWPHRVAYHDPCYLGRVNGLIEAPRRILEAVPDLEMLLPANSGRDTFCCGAGGGRMWLHESGVRINQLRAGQCRETGADQVATACPYCLVMLEDGLAESRMRTLDIIEIVEWVTR